MATDKVTGLKRNLINKLGKAQDMSSLLEVMSNVNQICFLESLNQKMQKETELGVSERSL